MADKKLNAVSTASDGAYVYAEDANGNQIKISKADLASVVAGILGFNGSIQDRGLIVSGSNMDNLGMGVWNRYSGTYDIQNKPPYDSFIAIVLISGSYKYQFAQNASNINESVSRVFYSGQWSGWK